MQVGNLLSWVIFAAVGEPLLQMDFADLDQWRLLLLLGLVGPPPVLASLGPSLLSSPLLLLGPFPLLRRLMLHPDRKSERGNEGNERKRGGLPSLCCRIRSPKAQVLSQYHPLILREKIKFSGIQEE